MQALLQQILKNTDGKYEKKNKKQSKHSCVPGVNRMQISERWNRLASLPLAERYNLLAAHCRTPLNGLAVQISVGILGLLVIIDDDR